MVTVIVADESRPFEDADPFWINQKVARRHRDGLLTCVQIEVNLPGAHLNLATPTCAGGAGGSRPPNQLEHRVIEEWRQHGLDQRDFNSGKIVSFLRALKKLLGL